MACLELGPLQDPAQAVMLDEELEDVDGQGRVLCYGERPHRDYRRAVAVACKSPLWAFRTTQQLVSSFGKVMIWTTRQEAELSPTLRLRSGRSSLLRCRGFAWIRRFRFSFGRYKIVGDYFKVEDKV